MEGEKLKHKKKSIMIMVGVVGLLLLTSMFMVSLLSNITAKMNQNANDTLLDSTRMIKSSLDNAFSIDEHLLQNSAYLFPINEKTTDAVAMLANFTAATDFFRLYYVDMDGMGIDNLGVQLTADELPFQEFALSKGERGYSDAYIGSSGRLQVTFQEPVFDGARQIGALYADKTLVRYNNPALFTFSGGAGHSYVINGSEGNWIIESTGTDAADIYAFLAQQGNGEDIQEALRKLLAAGKTGTIGVTFHEESSILGFLPLDNSHNWYVISLLPKRILLQESYDIMRMITITLVVLLIALVLITVLLLSRQTMLHREKSRKYQEQLFQNISANVNFAFLLYSPDEKCVEMVSNNVHFLFDLEPAQAALHPDKLFDRCGMPETDEGRKAFFGGKLDKKIQKEYKVGTDNGLMRWTEVNLIPADNGKYLAVLDDTTDEHYMRDDLAEALQQAEESNRARTAFFSAMSHDIRTPMNGIIGMTAVARNNLNDAAKLEDCLDKISVASDHLLALINEILDMSRIESGKVDLKKERVDLAQLIAKVLLLVKPELNKKRHTMQVKSAVLAYNEVLGNMLHLQKILLNLLTNAIKYTPDGGEICIQVSERPQTEGRIDVIFQVKDSGIGMTPEFLERIFEPFERAEDSRVSKINGTGLGMAITKNLVDTMGGTIEVESQLGVGSTFTVTLPLSVALDDVCQEEVLSGLRVLVAGQDDEICASMGATLSELGMVVETAPDGLETVKMVRAAHQAGQGYFAVLMDRQLPKQNGLEASRQIREMLGPGGPIILLCTYDREDIAEAALEAGVDDFLTKPLFKQEVVKKLRYFCGDDLETESEAHVELPPAEDFAGMRILLVEDNDLNREVAEELLHNSGIQVEGVENGLLAVERFEQSKAGYYDLILMDIHMPVMDGLSAAKAIRRLVKEGAASIPIIAMTADAFEEDIRQCRAAGMDAHIAKPVDIQKLLELIGQYRQKESGE